jgi:hypothetical protein
MAFGGVSFDDQILSFDVTQPAQLGEKCALASVAERRARAPA